MSELPRQFSTFSDEWLDELAYALMAAAGESAFDTGSALADALRAEYMSRGRMMPLAHADHRVAPADWRF